MALLAAIDFDYTQPFPLGFTDVESPLTISDEYQGSYAFSKSFATVDCIVYRHQMRKQT